MIFEKSGGAVDWLIVGLGNPGQKYEHTRHNMGFLTVDLLAEQLNVKLNKVKFKSAYNIVRFGGQKCLVMKPQTYMNLSGEAVREAAQFYKIPADHVLVIYDDVSLPVGKLRVRPTGSAGGHNGIKNIIAHLGTQDFPRIKIGTGADFDAGEILGAQVGDDVLDAVMTTGGAGGPHPQLAHGEGHVIVDHQHMVGGNFVELRSLTDGFAGEVHIGLGLHHQALLAPEADDVIGRLELHFVQFHVQLFRQQIHREKAHIVAGVLIFLAGIAQAHDEPVHRPAGFFKDHREFLLVCLYHIPKETGKQVCFPVFYITLNALILGRIVTGTAWRWKPPDRYARWPQRTWKPRTDT